MVDVVWRYSILLGETPTTPAQAEQANFNVTIQWAQSYSNKHGTQNDVVACQWDSQCCLMHQSQWIGLVFSSHLGNEILLFCSRREIMSVDMWALIIPHCVCMLRFKSQFSYISLRTLTRQSSLIHWRFFKVTRNKNEVTVCWRGGASM